MNDKEKAHSEMLSGHAAACARGYKEKLPAGIGILVLTFDFGGPGHMGYASTGRREDCIKMLREFLNNFEGN